MTRERLVSIDLLRGLVMIIMALDHARDMVSPLPPSFDFGTADPALFFTRWITHFCAPTFILLAGTSAYLYGAGGRTKPELSRFLFTRGLWLIFVELTIVGFAWNFNLSSAYIPILGVIWAIGVSMILLAVLIWLPMPVIAFIAILMIVGHNALDAIQPARDNASPGWLLLHITGFMMISERIGAFVAYPLIPWMGVMALGYVIAPVFTAQPDRRAARLINIGIVAIAAFVLMRYFNLYGESNPWQSQANVAATVVDFLHTSKYPPSLQYLLMTLGPAVLLLGIFEKCRGRWIEPIINIGRVPFLFYVVHLYLIHAMSVVLGTAQGFPIDRLMVAFPRLPEGFGVSLGGAYVFWIAAILMLYPMCHWFAAVKRRRRDWWLSYL